MSHSLHLDGFHFIATMTFPHQSEKSKPFGQAYYLPPLPRVITRLHPIKLSLAMERLFSKCLFLDSSLHQVLALFGTELIFFHVFLSLLSQNSHSCIIPGLRFKKCFFSAPFQWVSHINGKPTNKTKKRCVPDNDVRCLCISILSSVVLWQILKVSEQSRFAFSPRSDCVRRIEFKKSLSSVILPLLTSYPYRSAIFIDDLMLLGISRIHQEDCCHGNNVATGRVK